MEPIKIDGTLETPRVIFDKENNYFEISGRSLPEDAIKFYLPVFQWLDRYVEQPNEKTEMVCKFDYFNTISSKAILDIFERLEKIHKKGLSVQVNWYHLEADTEMKEAGRKFENLVKVPFNFVIY